MNAFYIFPAIIIALAGSTGYVCANGRPPKKWAIWAAFWGPVPLAILVLLPKRQS